MDDESFQPFEGAEANSDSESSSEELTDGDRDLVRELTDRLGRISVARWRSSIFRFSEQLLFVERNL